MSQHSPYWGQLPPPNVTRGNSLRREDGNVVKGKNGLSVDTTMAGERTSYPAPSRPRHSNRYSMQTDKTEAPTLSTQSPFASTIASEFRGEELAPRPPSISYGASDYNQDFSERRRRRETRNREANAEYEPIESLPAAPDVPRAPPVSYKQPHSNGPPTSYQPPVRARTTRRSEAPVSPGKAVPADCQRDRGVLADEDITQVRGEPTNGKGKGVIRRGISQKEEPSPDHIDLPSRRKGSLTDAEILRRREWAPDRSPLQRLELTLDSITKEEKRARVEEAELIARESKTGRGGERINQNSARFRNRPIAKGPDPGTKVEPQTLPEAGLVRSISGKQKDQLQRSGTVEKKKPVQLEDPQSSKTQSFEYEPQKPTLKESPKVEETTPPQRGPSLRERSQIPVAAGIAAATGAATLGQSESKRLKKNPPGDPWYKSRKEAEEQYQDVAPRRREVSNQQEPSPRSGPSRETAFRSHPQAIDKELPSLPKDSPPESSARPLNYLDSDFEEMDVKPMRRGTLTKIQKLTGEKFPTQSPKQTGKGIRTELVTIDGVKYAVPPTATDKSTKESNHHHHLSNILHRHENVPGQGVYVSPRRLDEWKKGGVAQLSGALLDLDMDDKRSEAEKDKAWWEAGNTGRRRNSTKQRKAEAYDGEYDDSAVLLLRGVNLKARNRAGYDKKTPAKVAGDGTNKSDPSSLAYPPHSNFLAVPKPLVPIASIRTIREHSLTCPMRAIRIRPDIAPTRFKPPLFLKSGPMLRYCGLRTEKPRSRSPRAAPIAEREIWRGSVMIVTQDSHSSYELAPTLRLFLQPMDLLPPPPAQLDGEELAVEYVDPLAGLPKIGRDGRTLYVRPVEDLEEEKDLSREESDEGLYEMNRTPMDGAADHKPGCQKPNYDGEKAGKYKEVRGFRLHSEQGLTFWRFNLEIELREKQQRIAYRINRGPATGFWVPPRGEAMNIMFHSCNGFSHDVDPNAFCGPDPMWRDVLNTHQTQPFHVMLGGGDQIYNDLVMEETTIFKEWSAISDSHRKEHVPFSPELQAELEAFYLDRYCMWFSQGLFGLAVSQIPMVNILDDHDIIDGFGSYPDDYMRSPVFSGLGAVAFKYYMLFQHQSSIDEGEETEPSWILGTQPGPYIKELSRSVFTQLGRSIAFLALDCRTERMFDEIVSAETYHKVFDRLQKEIVKGQTKHLIVLVGVPVAYPRMVWLENILTSRAFEPIKAMGRAGLLSKNLLNHMDGGVEILDDLNDHWTARKHKDERNWFIQELQDLAAEKSVRVTILGGDVHLGAIGQFYSNPKLGIPKDRDFRYMPNVISSAIVNAPPPDTLADLLNKRNKVHHLDADTDEDMIPIFTHDTNGKPRNNKRLLNRRNWCSIRLYDPELSPPPTPVQIDATITPPPRAGLLRRLSGSRGPRYAPDAATSPRTGLFGRRGTTDNRPPLSNPGFFSRQEPTSREPRSSRGSMDSDRPPSLIQRTLSLTRKDFTGLFRGNSSKRRPDSGGINGYGAESDDDISHYESESRSGIRGGSGGHDDDDESYFPSMPAPAARVAKHPIEGASTSVVGGTPQRGIPSPLQRGKFHRMPTGLSEKAAKKTGSREINLEGGLDICLNMEISSKDPAGTTMPYRLLVPALWYEEEGPMEDQGRGRGVKEGLKRWTSFRRRVKEGVSPERLGRVGSGSERR